MRCCEYKKSLLKGINCSAELTLSVPVKFKSVSESGKDSSVKFIDCRKYIRFC